jgi:hypothetical protein
MYILTILLNAKNLGLGSVSGLIWTFPHFVIKAFFIYSFLVCFRLETI